MTEGRLPVALVQVPEILNSGQMRRFLDEMQICMNTIRPRIVLDCSRLRRMDRAVIHLMLCGLEETLKHNGDLRLAALPEGASREFYLSGLERLFDVFETIPDAVNSFYPAAKGAPLLQDIDRSSNTTA